MSDDVKPYTREQLASIQAEWETGVLAGGMARSTIGRLLATARASLADTERLDVLIDWLSHHDDLEGSGIRDWNDNADARAAIDESVAKRSGANDG